MSTNEAAERLRRWILRYLPDAATDPYGTDTLDAALAHERSAGAAHATPFGPRTFTDSEQAEAGDPPDQPIPIEPSDEPERSAGAAPIDVERMLETEGCLLRECDHEYTADCVDDFRARLASEGTDR